MAFLFFLAGLEIDLVAIRGGPLRMALGAWSACFALALATAYLGRALEVFDAWIVLGTALGLFAALFVLRIPLIAIHRRSVPGRTSIAVGLFSATTLSLIVALTQIAVANGTMRPEEASPLVVAGVLSVLVFPLIALTLIGKPVVRGAGVLDDRGGL
jgi:Kef-type K+ transport system membrane component KefB